MKLEFSPLKKKLSPLSGGTIFLMGGIPPNFPWTLGPPGVKFFKKWGAGGGQIFLEIFLGDTHTWGGSPDLPL